MSVMIFVSAKPGQNALTRMPSGASAGPSARTRPTTACLLAPYTGSNAVAVSPAIEAVATIEPPPARRSAGIAACTPKTTPSRLMPIARRYFAMSKSSAMPHPVEIARVEERQVEPPVHLLGGLGRGQHLVVRRHVAAQEVAPDLVGDGLAAGLVHVEQDDGVTAPDQLPGDLGPEAGGARR